MQTVALGQTIEFNSVLKRNIQYANDYRIRLKVWEETPLKKPSTSIVIGIRTLSNGKTDWNSKTGFTTYSPKEYIKALVIATSLHSALVYVKYEK